ncbi:MAG: SCO family protein [Methylovirgula sp.]
MTRGFVPLLSIVLAIGIGGLAWATEGFRIITSEGARQLSVARHPIPVPDVRLLDQDGHTFSLADYRGRTVLVDFIYTRCPTLCGVLGDDFRRALASNPEAVSGHAVAFVSISFDRADDRNALQLYADRFGATAPRWRVAAPAEASGLAMLLRTFGVTFIPDGFGGFVHDDTIYVVDERGRLARMLDPDALVAAVHP